MPGIVERRCPCRAELFPTLEGYYERFHSIHQNVWLGLMYNVKRIGVWEFETNLSRNWLPPPTGLRGI